MLVHAVLAKHERLAGLQQGYRSRESRGELPRGGRGQGIETVDGTGGRQQGRIDVATGLVGGDTGVGVDARGLRRGEYVVDDDVRQRLHALVDDGGLIGVADPILVDRFAAGEEDCGAEEREGVSTKNAVHHNDL